MGDMLELPGVDEHEAEQGHYSARLQTFKALRCLYMVLPPAPRHRRGHNPRVVCEPLPA